MSNHHNMRKTEHMMKFWILVLFGISIQSFLIFTPVLSFIDTNQVEFFPLDFIVAYLLISFVYSLVVSLYMYPSLIISPYYIHLGTAVFVIFTIIIHLVVLDIGIDNVGGSLLPILAEIGLFVIVGLGMSLFLRKMFGVYGEPKDMWNETYRIEADFDLIKKIFDDDLFKRYDKDVSEENTVILKRNFDDVNILILLQPDSTSPSESILSISTTEIRFESMWDTEESKKALTSIKKIIAGVLYTTFHRDLILDTEEKIVSSKCEYLLLESKKSILAKIEKPSTKTIVTIVGSLTVGGLATYFFINQPVTVGSESKLMSMDTLIGTWVGVVLGILFSAGSEIKKKISKK